jgi:hypothetical protein
MPNEPHAPIGADELAELRRLDAEAVSAPWYATQPVEPHGWWVLAAGALPARIGAPTGGFNRAEAALIAKVRNALPALLTLAERGLAAGAGDDETADRLAEHFWSLHPADLDRRGYTADKHRNPRQRYYRDQILAALATARAQERERCEGRINEMINIYANPDVDGRTNRACVAALQNALGAIRNTQPEG